MKGTAMKRLLMIGSLLLLPVGAWAQTPGVTVNLGGSLPVAVPFANLFNQGTVCANSGTVVLPTGYGMVLPCNSSGQLVTSGGGGGGGGAITVAPITYSTNGTASVATTSGAFATAGQYTAALQICTLPTATANVWLNVRGGAAVANSGIPVYAGGGCTNFGALALPLPTAAINAITDGGVSQTVVVAGG